MKSSLMQSVAASLAALFLAGLPRATAADPFLAKQDVFVRGTDGHAAYRIPGLVANKSGALLLFCDGRVNGASDFGKMNLVLRRSLDGGKTWEKMQVLYTDEKAEAKIGNVSAVADLQTGEVHVVFCKNLEQAFCLTSKDDGATFGPAVEITKTFQEFPIEWKWFATGHAHGIQLASGRLSIPVFLGMVPRAGKEPDDFRVGTIFSDDRGKTWHAGGTVPEDGLLNESTIYEAADGGMVINSRSTRRSVRMVARSGDAGKTWSKADGDGALRAPSACQASTLVTKDAKGNRVVLFSHSAGPSRSNLTVRASYDDGLTWPVARVVESSPAAYGDLALGPDGAIYLGYENGTKQPYEKITVARFNLDWVLDGKEVGVPPPVASIDKAPALDEAGKITVDETDAKFTGEWVASRMQKALAGNEYRHDGGTERGKKTAVFTPELPAAGEYAVRLLYPVIGKSASNAKVTLVTADGEKVLAVNQRENPPKLGLGVFRFEAGRKASLTLSNAGADGFVVADGVQFVPAGSGSLSKEESGSLIKEEVSGDVVVEEKPALAREPVQLAKPVEPSAVDGKTYDLVVVGGTPGGIACAVRGAREGLKVLLVQHNQHIGGMLTNSLFQWDALYAGYRAPIFNQTARLIEEFYRRAYGDNSKQFKVAQFTQSHYPMSRFEPSTAEREFNRLVAGEKNLSLLLGHYPSALEREGALLRGVTLREYGGTKEVKVRATVFADGTYEGDLAALAKVPYRVGREGRDEFGEPHAGKVFCNIGPGPGPKDAVEGRLNLHPYAHKQGKVDETSPFTADKAIQAFNYRFCLSADPKNRRLPEKPANYNREEYVNYNRKGMSGGTLNGKGTFNSAILPGENHAYPDATWEEREKIIQRHKEFALGLMYFLQNDESVSPAKREGYRKVGLPLDEFPDNDNIPYEMYVREARRIVGRYVLTQLDNMFAPGLSRTPVFADSIGFTDWSMDSHDCSNDRRPGFEYDGKLILTEESRPAHVPWRALLPQGVDNLIVPVCLSATHVAWGSIRLEPVWMQVGESAGVAAALCVKGKVAPAQLDPDKLVRELCQRRFMVAFFNDIQMGSKDARYPAIQYLATKGFYNSYDARPDAPLTAEEAKAWAPLFARLVSKQITNPTEEARALPVTTAQDGKGVTAGEFAAQLKIALTDVPNPARIEQAMAALNVKPSDVLTRGEASQLLFQASEGR